MVFSTRVILEWGPERFLILAVCCMTCLRLSATILAACILCPATLPAGQPLEGRKIADFQLNDFRGKACSLAELSAKPIVVVAFLGTECPLVKLYGPRLAALAKEYESKSVAFLAINSNSQDSITEIAAYARTHAIGFPILKDLSNKVADQFGALRTPEVFVLDRDRVVRYHGRIDDQFAIGVTRDAPRQQNLKTAIDELLAGKKVSVPETESVGCHIGRIKKPVENSPVTYSNQISRLLQNRCVECHRPGEIAPFSLTDYGEVAGWARMIEEVVEENRMPPWHADPQIGKFAGDRRLAEVEKQLIRDWVKNGAPEGNPKDLPPPKKYVTGWQLPQHPDLVLPMRDKPFPVPAEGQIPYKMFGVDTTFGEDKWIQAVEVVPGNPSVVHHILVFARPKGTKEYRDEVNGGYLAAFVPGLRARVYPPGMAKRLPAGSRLFFQVHYAPNGSPQTDRSSIGFVFTDPQKVTHEVQSAGSGNLKLAIPPYTADYRAEGRPVRCLSEIVLLSMMPHMHLRGKSMYFEALFPDGKSEILLDIPRYDFNWQMTYELQTPRQFPTNTRVRVVGRFDNSADNPHNPDPSKTVRWGAQVKDEMLLGYFDFAIPRVKVAADPKGPPVDSADMQRARQIVDQFDDNGDEKLSRTEVPERLRKMFDRLDMDKDGQLVPLDFLRVLDQIR